MCHDTLVLGVLAQDVGVTCHLLVDYHSATRRGVHTGIENGHDGAAEELTASSAQLNLDRY
jgi:hypothetical protein